MTETRKIIELLYARHPKPEWACFAELRNGTGSAYSRTIDFLAINCYPSKRFRTVAYEIKVSRHDFTNEISDPSKRAYAEKFAHECYFAMPKGLVAKDEIPEGWGLLECTAGGLRRTKIATQRENVDWPHSFMVSIARRCADEPSPLPAATWKLEGKEVDEEQLIAVAESTLKASIDLEVRMAANSVLNSADYQKKAALERVVKSALGFPYYCDVLEEFQKWHKQQDMPSRLDMATLRNAYRMIGDFLGEHED